MTLVLPPSLAGPMEKRQRDDAVYVTGLPDDVNTDKLSELFGSIGVIKVRGWLCGGLVLCACSCFLLSSRITAGPTPL